MAGNDAEQLQAARGCVVRQGVRHRRPLPGVLTFVSRGTDDDAHGVLAGLRSDRRHRTRTRATTGWDIVHVTLRKADLERVPESRIHTALEASLNCEVPHSYGVTSR